MHNSHSYQSRILHSGDITSIKGQPQGLIGRFESIRTIEA